MIERRQNYLIVDCGYTSRLIEHFDEMDPKPIFIYDSLWGDGLTKFDCTDAEVEKMCIYGIISDGTIVFRYKDNDQFSIVETVKMLQQFRHCAFFYIDDYYGIDPDEDHSNLREIVDSDLNNFVNDNVEYYNGTLYEVKITEVPDYKVTYLYFDSESG